MNRTRSSTAVVLAAVLLLGLRLAGCSSDNSSDGAAPASPTGRGGGASSGRPSGGAAGSGVSASPGMGGAPGSGGSASPGMGGVAGAAAGTGGSGGGAAGTAGASASTPKWIPLDLGFAGCSKLERLANPDAVGPAFTWKPCVTGIDGCEQLEPAALFAGASDRSFEATKVYDDGTTKWILFGVTHTSSSTRTDVILATLDGAIALAVRSDKPDCSMATSGLDAGHFAIPLAEEVSADGTMTTTATLVGALGMGIVPNVSQPVSVIQGSSPAASAFANGRASLQWRGGVQLTSIDDETGQSSVYLAGSATFGELGMPISTPDLMIDDVASSPHWSIVSTDGSNKPTTYLSDPTADVLMPVFTGTHLAWVKGYGNSDLSWQKMEIWSSPYSSDPKQLQPTLLASWPFTGIVAETKGAHGRIGTVAAVTGADLHSVHVWTVPGGEHRQVTISQPASLYIGQFFGGLTRDEVVFGGHTMGVPGDPYIFRLPFEKMPVVPLGGART